MPWFFSFFCFLLSFLLCPLLIRLSPVVGGMDLPDGVRKTHARPTPRLGGMAFFFSFFLSSLLFLPGDEKTLALLFFGLLLLLSGFLDDTRTLSVRKKLLFQTVASGGVLLVCGVPREIVVSSRVLPLPLPIAFPLFLFYTVALINAVNFTDGADGLAAAGVLPALLSLSLLFSFSGGGKDALPPLFLFFALLGFLPFNRAPAKLFMGDAGSQFLGFALAHFTLGAEVFPLSRLLFAALPLADLCVTVGGRLRRGASPFTADRTHLHHRLAARGASVWEIVFFAAAFSFAAAMLGVSLSFL